MLASPLSTLLLGAACIARAAEISDLESRFVEQNLRDTAGQSELNMSIQMLGLEVKGSHVLGHLVKVDNPNGRVSVAMPPGGCGTREYTTVTAQKHEPRCRLAINAGYFNVNDASCIGNLVVDGNVIQTVPLNESNVNFGIRGGKLAFGYFTPQEIQGFEQLVSGVTWLVRDGKNCVEQGWAEANITVQTSGDKYISNLASRTAVGVDELGRLIIMQIDGSIAVGHNKRGVNMYQLADLLLEHGAVHAINLDGGGSSAMARDGMLVNYPSDSKPPSCDESGKYQCERPVSTILCVHELPETSWIGALSIVGESNLGTAGNTITLVAVGIAFFLAGCVGYFCVSMLQSSAKRRSKSQSRCTDLDFARQSSGESISSMSTDNAAP